MPEAAVAAFRQVLGAEHVLTGAALDAYRRCTMPLQRRIPAVLRPVSVDEVQQLVRIAGDHGVPLYPISTGNNWGYGTAQPARDDTVVVDLRRMNRVVTVDADLAFAVVEPGVTQRQLYTELRQRGLRLWINPTGAGPDCSILGNTLERGFGIGPNGDHFQAQCGMEVVLAGGEILRTGFGHYPGAQATYVYKYGVGPYLDGLFTQSSYGIVTKMGVWLMPEPEHFEACYLTCNAEEQLGPLIDGLRQLLFGGVFQGPVNLLHRDRVLVMHGRYPWRQMSDRTPLNETVASRLAARLKIGAWNGVGALAGSRAQVRAARQTIRAVLGARVDRLTFLSDARLRVLQRFPRALSAVLRMNVPDLLKTLEASYGMMKGVPSEVALPLSYWRNRQTPPPAADLDPARDNCGLMWFAPIIPMTPAHVLEFRRIVEPIVARHGFESCITLTAVNERAFDCTLPILYDRSDEAETDRAERCHAELVEQCRQHGYIAYRLGLQSMAEETSRDDVFWSVVQKVKQALDPQGIISPGRYSR